MTKSALQIARAAYVPKMPVALRGSVRAVEGAATEAAGDKEEIKRLFPHTYGMPAVTFERGDAADPMPPINAGVILSGGQAQRVGVARALAADPGVLLMDEPFGAVDPLVRRELQRELIRIQADLAKTIVFVTHDVDEALLLGDEIILLSEGARIAQRGTGAELVADPADDFVARFLGLDDSERALRLHEIAGRHVVQDAVGRTLGVLDAAEDALAAAHPHEAVGT